MEVLSEVPDLNLYLENLTNFHTFYVGGFVFLIYVMISQVH